MSANSLLLWMSARGKGTWQQFRAAVESLHLPETESADGYGDVEHGGMRNEFPLYMELRLNLQRMGHAEFFHGAAGSDWMVTPPCVAVTEQNGGAVGVIVGARSKMLLGRVSEIVDGYLETIESDGAPDVMRIVGKDVKPIVVIGRKAGVLVQSNAPETILLNLPPVDDPRVARKTDLPLGTEWRIEQFSPQDLVWRLSTREDAIGSTWGLFRFTLRHRQHVFVCSKRTARQIPNQVGKYIALRRAKKRKVLRYDPVSLCMSVPASCRPPLLVERALVLCSGLLPSYEGAGRNPGILHYRDIPRNIAGLASALLRQG